MGRRSERVVIMRREALSSEEVCQIADLAYGLWLSTGFRGGTPEEALTTAVRQRSRNATPGLYLVPKPSTYTPE